MGSRDKAGEVARGIAAAVIQELATRVKDDPEQVVDAGARLIRKAYSATTGDVATRQDVLTFAEAMRFFPANRAGAKGAKAGAVLRMRSGSRQDILLLYLDAHNAPLPEGAPMALYSVRDLDDELRAAFKGRDLIIVN
jgi:hypothetical protein